MRQEEFNWLVFIFLILAIFAHFSRHSLHRWLNERYREWNARKSRSKKTLTKRKEEVPKDSEEISRRAMKEAAQAARRASTVAKRTAAAKRTTMQAMTARQLLEALSSGSSGPPSADLGFDEPDDSFKAHDIGEDEKPADFDGHFTGHSYGKAEVCVMHDIRRGKAPDAVIEALGDAAFFDERLRGLRIWDFVTKRNRLKVTASLRWSGSSWEALGFALYRTHHQTLQLVYIAVAPEERRNHVGRHLVKALREMARRDPLCLAIMALLDNQQQTEEAVGFFKAVGFKRGLLRVVDGETEEPPTQACFQIDIRKVGKRARKQMGSAATHGHNILLEWSDILKEARRGTFASIKLPAPAVSRSEPSKQEAAEEKVKNSSHARVEPELAQGVDEEVDEEDPEDEREVEQDSAAGGSEDNHPLQEIDMQTVSDEPSKPPVTTATSSTERRWGRQGVAWEPTLRRSLLTEPAVRPRRANVR